MIFLQLLVGVCLEVLRIAPREWIVGFVSLFLSHGVSLAVHYFWNGEYRQASVQDLMFAPYKRIMLLHFAVLFGGFGVMALGSPIWMLVVLVVIKIGMDWKLHTREHAKASAS